MRIFTQHFTHGKVVRYTKPHRKVAAMFTKALGSRHNLNLRFTEVILLELKGFATRLKNNKKLHINCCPMITRICYYAVGMIDELPPPIALDQWLEVCQAPPLVTVRAEGASASTPKKKGKATRSKGKAKAAMRGRVTPSKSSASSKVKTTEPDDDSERTDINEEKKKIKEELRNQPAVSAQRKQWEEI